VNINVTVFWTLTPCSLVYNCPRLVGSCCLYLSVPSISLRNITQLPDKGVKSQKTVVVIFFTHITVTQIRLRITRESSRQAVYKRQRRRPLACPIIVSHCYKLASLTTVITVSNEHINPLNMRTTDLDHISAN
jgi:hypothetical protein